MSAEKIFIPLKTFQGLLPSEIKRIIGSRRIYIWGCGHLGRSLKKVFEKNSLPVFAFCDSNIREPSQKFEELIIIKPEQALEDAKLNQALIVIASARHRLEMEKKCQDFGLNNKEGYLSYLSISRPEASVEIAGNSHDENQSGPLANFSSRNMEGLMSFSNYRKVLTKLVQEIPHLVNIELSTWGEPMLNPDLADIIQETEKHLSCSVTTSLQIIDRLDSVIKAKPSQFNVIVGGFESSYEQNHSGASWNNFHKNLILLKNLAHEHSQKTQVTISYQLYQNNRQDDLNSMRKLCNSLGLRFNSAWTYLNPYEKLFNFLSSQKISEGDRRIIELLPWKVSNALSLVSEDTAKPCLCQRIFPVINWDLSVSLCHIYQNPVISKNFLLTSLDELLEIRHNQKHCIKCQNIGLHRLDIEVLLKKHPKNTFLKDAYE